MTGNHWKIPLNLAVGFHLLVGLSAVYLPDIFDVKPRYEDIYTVNLVNLTEQPAAPESISAPEPQSKPLQETVPEKAVSVAPPAPEPLAAPPKAVSIKPLRKKKKKKIVKKPEPQKTNQDALKRQKLAEMLKAQQEADEQARLLAEEAAREKKMLQQVRTKPTPRNTNSTGDTPSSARSGGQLSSIETQYYATINSRLQSLWSLPEYKTWDPSLSASVVITIRKNGEIADSFFEKKSGDRIFDRFVTKTLQDVGKLPPIPPVLKKQRLEIGLIFSPGQIR
ncbi:TonB C-terminal domain-containing protein [Desulfopila sp. IMCC35008]|uniref:TonB C-terminal domain-containing protein n=1 Tax=Desulfopila sp. IMCC35008 TaxID=2653858 RepID=UPI0013D62CE9|nr:TonB C-terminal domain-containing protein [Desulfopila sp. IMCC35008]